MTSSDPVDGRDGTRLVDDSPHRNEYGYGHPLYTASFAEWGEPLALRGSAGWLLARPIPNSTRRDAMGPYPFLSCADWSALAKDIAGLPDDLVSLTVVTDPFGGFDLDALRGCFNQVRDFKGHRVADLNLPINERVSPHHRRRAAKSLRLHQVEVLERPHEHLTEWLALYENLVRRHGLSGMKAYSPHSFEQQLTVPGLVAFRAQHDGETVAMTLWYVQGRVAYGHLAAASPRGYANAAMYALDWFASEWFVDRCRWLAFGGPPSLVTGDGSGLEAYKRGWCTDVVRAYLCWSILDPATYASLSARQADTDLSYFPAYRAGEML